MTKMHIDRSVELDAPVERLWEWHLREGAFERLAPPWQRMELLKGPSEMKAGEEVLIRLRLACFSKLWRARITEVGEGRFVDLQEKGPFAYWRHEHSMKEATQDTSILSDKVEYRLPPWFSWIPGIKGLAGQEMERLFDFRHQRMRLDFQRYKGRQPGRGRTVLVTGSSGLIGRRLVPFLKTLGFRVRGLTRGRPQEDIFRWDPGRQWMDPAALEAVDVVIHLAGENIAGGRWTKSRKARIRDSRISGTRTLVSAFSSMKHPPHALISASGVNFYDKGPSVKTEDSAVGQGFLAEVCRDWEQEALKAGDLGIRTVCLRTGVVLDPAGGALGKMLPAFMMGFGGPMGSGRQGLPWIGVDDLLDVMVHAVETESLQGAVNAVHSHALDNREFSTCLGKVLHRPALIRLPAGLLRLLLGEMAQETLLADLQVRSAALSESGFKFRHENLEGTLRHLLGR